MSSTLSALLCVVLLSSARVRGDDRPLIAIVACVSSRNIPHKEVTHMALHSILVPSVINTTEDGFRYAFHFGVDADDRFWRNSSHILKIKDLAWPVPVVFHAFDTEEDHIPFNEVLWMAFLTGADYLVRVNDDTRFVTPAWSSAATNALRSFDPPNVGVVGPTCPDGNSAIMTHDMVHRTHMRIFFGVYYPHAFSNWFMDDWISAVYGPQRTLKLSSWVVRHHTKHHGRRYRVVDHRGVLEHEIREGRRKISQHLDSLGP